MDETTLTERLCDFYQKRIDNQGVSYQTVWGDTAEWKAYARFKIIEKDDFADTDQILDLGCGHGLLYKYLQFIKVNAEYVGVDVITDFINHVAAEYNVNTLNINFFNNLNSVPSSEWYAIFGSINKKWMVGLDDNQSEDSVYAWINELFSKSTKGVYLNCFSAKTSTPKANNIHLDPMKIIANLGDKVRFYRIRHDLDFYEFSLMMRK